METIVAILIILTFSTLMGELFGRFGLEKIAGQLLSGIILGPLLLNLIKPQDVSSIKDLAIFFIILYIGIEVTTDLFKKGIKRAIILSTSSFIIPMILLSAIMVLVFKFNLSSSISMSMAIAVPSISIISVLVIRAGMIKSESGQGILFATVLSDLIAFVVLSIFYVGFKGLFIMLIVITAFLLSIFIIDDIFIKKGISIERIKFISDITKEEGVFTIILLFSLAVASIFLFVGVSFILGVFFAGVLIREEILGKALYDKLLGTLRILNNSFFIPLFFSIAGLITSLPEGEYAKILIIALAIELTLPFISDYLVAKKLYGRDARRVAGILSGRGAVGLLIATLGLSYSLINENQYSVIIIATLVLSLYGSIMIRQQSR
jgi:Kef-type K+ transport system membrane component KefB